MLNLPSVARRRKGLSRRAILARLAEGGATVNELAEPFVMTLPAISKHIKVLERAGTLPGTPVVIERSFDAPADLIWRMWTDPEHFKDNLAAHVRQMIADQN
jgi:Helix-turn-helix domain